jgi:hypothetical protein
MPASSLPHLLITLLLIVLGCQYLLLIYICLLLP